MHHTSFPPPAIEIMASFSGVSEDIVHLILKNYGTAYAEQLFQKYFDITVVSANEEVHKHQFMIDGVPFVTCTNLPANLCEDIELN